MKKIVVLIIGLLMACIVVVKAQYATVADVKFTSSIPSGWSVSPSGGWAINTNFYVSSPSSVLGYVPNSIGDSVVLISPYYDFGTYAIVYLRFSHICKVASSDICKVYLQENYSGAKWKELPSASYKGADNMAYRNNSFSHESYTDWVPSDSLATPTNAWWKTEPFDISDEASFAKVRFRFVIKRGSVAWTQFAYGWLIDNFELMASSYAIVPPVVDILSSSPTDTVYNTGPFTVTAKIVSRTIAPLKLPIYLQLTYKYNNITRYDSIQMSKIQGDSIWGALIPQQLYGTSISYSIYAADSFGNNAGDASAFYLKKFIGGNPTGYVTVGSQTNTNSYNILYYNSDYSWSRQLYLGTELNPLGTGSVITKIAFQPTSTWNIGSQKCYLKVVTDVSLSTTYIDPLSDGYTLVWSGTYPMVASTWSEIKLNTSFILPPGKNLMVYWTNEDGSRANNTSTAWYASSTSPTRAVYGQQNGTFPITAGNLNSYRPNIRMYMVEALNDSIGVSLFAIDNPTDSVVAALGHQVPIIITIKNQGLGVLDSCLINWTLNGELKPSRKWKGHLLESFKGQDTIGYYIPSLNQFDTIVVWVSMPNGVQDYIISDDTLAVISYGITGLNMKFLSNVPDTVYNTGPFTITSLISSRTAVPVSSTVYLQLAYTYNSITTYDSIVMSRIANDTFQAIIPQHIFGTSISYSISVMDAVGNLISIGDDFYIHRFSGGALSGYVIVGTGTSTMEEAPIERHYDYSWSRMLYLGSELSVTSSGGLITKLAWQLATTCANGTNQACYFKEVTDTSMLNDAYLNPITDGATLVWSGTIDLSTAGWVELNLTTPFMLTPGKNLLISWENRDGAYVTPYSEWYYTMYSGIDLTSADFDDGTFPTYSSPINGGIGDIRPNARFYIVGGSDDTNSVALHSIDSPQQDVIVTPNGNSVAVKVTIKNKGRANLTSCNVSWELNGVYQGTKLWSGNLTEDFNDTITVGYYMPRGCNYDKITVWVANPNSVIDSNSYDDTLSIFVYGKTGIEVDLVGPVDTVFYTGPFTVDAQLISLTKTSIDTNVFLYTSYTYLGITTYDTIRMINTGNDTLWTASIPQHPFGSHVTYTMKLKDSILNNITINKWFYIKRPGIDVQSDSTIVGLIATSGVFVIPLDCRYAASYSRVVYTGTEMGVAASGATISSISWFSYAGAGYTYNATRTNQDVYFKVVSNTTTTINSGTYVDPISDGATLVWSGSMNLLATPGTWHKIKLTNPFTLPPNSNIIVYYVDQHGTAGATFAWTYQSVANSSAYGYGASLSSLLAQSVSDYKPWTCFGYSNLTSDSNGVAAYSLISPQNVTTAGIITPITLVIKNKGISNLTSCDIDWTINTIPQTPYHWTGSLYETFTDTIILGTYTPNLNNYDNIKVWVSSPNGYADTTNWDDTLQVNAFGQTGLMVEYVAPYVADTVYYIGPFEINAHIQSLTSVPVSTPTLHYVARLNGLTINDSVRMINVFPDSLWRVNIPKQAFGTNLTYLISVRDSSGNVITIIDSFYVKRPGGMNIVDSIQVGISVTGGQYTYPFTTNGNGNNWSRSLYLSKMMGNVNSSVTIAGISYVTSYNYAHTRYNTKCYLKATTATAIVTSDTYVNPIADGAALVYTGTWTTHLGWNQFVFDSSFVLPKGQNLLVYWIDTSSLNQCTNVSMVYWAENSTNTFSGVALYRGTDRHYTNYYCSGSGGGGVNNLPTTMFYLGGITKDSNSVALVNVVSPADTVQSYKNTPVRVVIKNAGMANLRSCFINWTINGVAQTTHAWTGNLLEDFSDTVTLGYFTAVKGTTYNFTFTVSLPNNVSDLITYDDYLIKKTYGDFKGKNLTMKQFISPLSNPFEVCFPESVSVGVRVANTGSVALILNSDPITLHYKINGPVSIQNSIIISQGVFGVGTKDIIVDTILDVNLPGIYHIEVFLSCLSDTLHFDDTIRMDYQVKKLVLPYDNDFSAITSDISFTQNTGTVRWAQDTNPSMTPVYGTGALYVNSALNFGISTAMMQSINLKGTLLPKLELWFAHDTNNVAKQDKIEVKVSADGFAYSTLKTITRYDSNFVIPGWQKYTIDLSNYSSGTCAVISFVATSASGGDMWIDRIAISSAQEIGIDLDIPTETDLIACNLDHKQIKVSVSNNTLSSIDFDQTPVILTVEVTGAKTISYSDTLTGILNGNTVLDVVLDTDFDFTLHGTYDFYAYITSIDADTDNDTASLSVVVSPDISLVSIESIGVRAIKEHVYPSVLLRNSGNLKIQEVPLRIQVNGINDVTETAYLNLAAGSDTLYTFNTSYVVPLEPTYDLMILVELACDPIQSNDTLRSTENASEPFVKVQNVLRPSSTVCDTGNAVIYPQIVINNTGSPEVDVVVYLSMDTASHVFASFVDTIAFVVSGTTTYNFETSYIVPNMPTSSTYNVKAYIYSPTYTYSQTACVIYNDVAVSDIHKDAWTLGQNIPNPAQSSITIPYTIPREGEVIVKIMSISGQVLYSQNTKTLQGDHSLAVNVESIANGIYYYSMEYEGQTIVKKMTIQK